jgi:uncharacterized protein
VTVLDELDWRREVLRLYSGVRAESFPSAAHAGWVAVRDRLLAEHPCSPADRDQPVVLQVPDHDPAWRVEVRLEPASPEVCATGGARFVRAGVLRTPWGPLDAWVLDGYGGGLWVPVRDAGSGRLSYAGGRNLYDTARGADLGTGPDGGLVLDLNFLYAPDCAHALRRPSPLAPPGNVLDVVVPVGELSLRPLRG